MTGEITVGNVSIAFEKVGAQITFSSVKVNGANFSDVIVKEFNSIKFGVGPARPEVSEVYFPSEFEPIIQSVFTAVDELYKTQKACLAGFLSSYIFERFTPLWMDLIGQGRHVWAIQLWRKLIFIAHQWEEKNQKHIHKGSPYVFIALTYLLVGDVDTGFSFIYNAIEENRKLNQVCPELNYPYAAPSYLTASLSSNTKNVMAPLVKEIRTELENYINDYNKEFGRGFSINEFDRLFLQNVNFESIMFYFVFNYWAIFEFRRKVGRKMMQNDFSKLKNADWFFALCLVIDKLLHSHPKYTGNTIGPEIENYAVFKGFMTKNDFNSLKNYENIPNGDPDQIIPKLLPMNLQHNGVPVRKEILNLFIAWNLRNFAGHNIQTQDVIASHFEDILKTLLFDIFLIVEEYRTLSPLSP